MRLQRILVLTSPFALLFLAVEAAPEAAPKKMEEQFKNIQVLKGYPAEDLFPTRPCPPGALAPWQAGELIGRRLAQPVERGEHGTLEHVARLAA